MPKPEDLGQRAGEPIVLEFAPQLELLKRAALCITHAGLNTALECLSNGGPMVAIPIINDQPGVAARVVWTQTGEVIALRKLNAPTLRSAIRSVLEDRRYRENAGKLQSAIQSENGIWTAADFNRGGAWEGAADLKQRTDSEAVLNNEPLAESIPGSYS